VANDDGLNVNEFGAHLFVGVLDSHCHPVACVTQQCRGGEAELGDEFTTTLVAG